MKKLALVFILLGGVSINTSTENGPIYYGTSIALADTSVSFLEEEDRLNTAKDLAGLENQVKSARAVIDGALTNLDKLKTKVSTNQGKFGSKDIEAVNLKLDGLIALLSNLKNRAQTIRDK